MQIKYITNKRVANNITEKGGFMELNQKQMTKYEVIQSTQQTVGVSVESIVPDSFPDILRVISATAVVCVKEKNHQNDRVIVSGTVNATAMCQSEADGSIVLIPVYIPFSHIEQVNSLTSTSKSVLDVELVQITTEKIHSRKISFMGELSVSLTAYQAEISAVEPEIVPCNDDKLNVLCEELESINTVCFCEKNVRIVENMKFNELGYVPVHHKSEFITEDKKVLQNKIMLRGSLKTTVAFFHTTDAQVLHETYNLPYSYIIEGDSIEPDDIVEIVYQTKWCDISISDGMNGMQMINFDISAEIAALVSRSRIVKNVTDAYSTLYEIDTHIENASYISGREVLRFSGEHEHTTSTCSGAVKILHFDTYAGNARISTSENKAYAELCVHILYCDNMGDTQCVREKYVLCCDAVVTGNISDCHVHITDIKMCPTENGQISILCSFEFCVTQYQITKTTRLVKCNVLRDSLKMRNTSASLLLRNVSENDTIWSIAKKYNASPDDILAANKLNSAADITPGNLIMIPIIK